MNTLGFESNETSSNDAEASAIQENSEQKLSDVFSDLPSEVLTGCGPEEAFRSDWKAAVFPVSKPDDAPPIESSPNVFHEEEILNLEDCFYFESDHLALKGNKDYLNMLSVLVTLQAQRTQAIKDVEKLLIEKKKALEDPIAFVARMQSGNLPEYPGPQKIAELPVIDWSKYNVSKPDSNMRPQTRHARTATESKNIKNEDELDKTLVRGRPCDESKPETFNQLWTVEEQKRLEELLVEYPSEETEMNRWTKIAKALGNRTPKQVSSRVQKYFIKLAKAGLPIPGRIPKARNEIKKTRHRSSFRRSTFFPHEQLYDEIVRNEFSKETDNNYNMEVKSENLDEDNFELRQIELLRQIKKEKDFNSTETLHHHLGYKCYICNDEPIKGTRWHCEECQLEEINLCSDCAVAQLEAEEPLHPSTHKLQAVRGPKYPKYYDTDYLPQNFNSTSYNYLDPNFLPE